MSAGMSLEQTRESRALHWVLQAGCMQAYDAFGKVETQLSCIDCPGACS